MIPAAALPAVALQNVLKPLGQATMLPAAAYTSLDVFRWEQRHLLAGSWLCVGRTTSLRARASQRAVRAGDLGVVLTFDGDEVRAFANVCRHRAHELLATGEANDRRALVCPYHAWSYNLDGRLKSAPRMEKPSMDKPDGLDLVPVPAVDWHGWTFVNATGTDRPFAEHLGSLDARVAPYRPENLEVKARHEYEVAANWKLLAENYHECYHCPQIHPELCAVTPPNSGDNWRPDGAWVGGSMELREHAMTMSLDGASRGIPLPGVDPRSVLYLGLFPNLLVSLHPDYVMTHRLEPLAPDRTRVECAWLFPSEVADPSYAVDFWDITNRQDWAACESVQRGVSSPHYIPGPLAPNEDAVHDWLTLVAHRYLAQDPAARSETDRSAGSWEGLSP